MHLIHKDVVHYDETEWSAFWLLGKTDATDEEIYEFLRLDPSAYNGGIGHVYVNPAYIERYENSVLIQQSGGRDI